MNDAKDVWYGCGENCNFQVDQKICSCVVVLPVDWSPFRPNFFWFWTNNWKVLPKEVTVPIFECWNVWF